jgi:beta-glucosidase
VDLAPGESTEVRLRLAITQLAFLGTDLRWRVEAGDVDVLVGASSADLRLQGTVRVLEDALVDGRSRGFSAG